MVKSRQMPNLAIEGELLRPYRFGRPSKLTKQLLQKAWDYVEQADNMSAATLLPTKERLALNLGISRQVMEDWKKTSPDFLDICNTLDQLQADKLVQNGLIGRYTPAIAAIMLSKHGYVKQEQVDTNVNVVQPLLAGLSKDTDALPADNDN